MLKWDCLSLQFVLSVWHTLKAIARLKSTSALHKNHTKQLDRPKVIKTNEYLDEYEPPSHGLNNIYLNCTSFDYIVNKSPKWRHEVGCFSIILRHSSINCAGRRRSSPLYQRRLCTASVNSFKAAIVHLIRVIKRCTLEPFVGFMVAHAIARS